MAAIPAKVRDRVKDNLGKIQKIPEQAKARDINEADTVAIVSDVLTDILGYDKYMEVTREYAVKGTYCDLATTARSPAQANVFDRPCKTIPFGTINQYRGGFYIRAYW